MKKKLALLTAVFAALCGTVYAERASPAPTEQDESVPTFLYKFLLPGQWKASQKGDRVVLGPEDADYIKLATEEQLAPIVKKRYLRKSFVLLQLASELIPGQLTYAYTTDDTECYQLRDGYIPLDAITDMVEWPPK